MLETVTISNTSEMSMLVNDTNKTWSLTPHQAPKADLSVMLVTALFYKLYDGDRLDALSNPCLGFGFPIG